MRIQVWDTQQVDQQQQAMSAWSQHYQQMSPGAFCGRIVHLQLSGVEVFEERMNTRVEQSFHAPTESLSFSFDSVENSLYLLNGDSQNTWITPEHYSEVGLVFSKAFLANTGCADLEALEGLFLTQLRSPHCRLFNSWLSKTLAGLAMATDQQESETLSRQLFDDCLFIVDSASNVLDVASGCRVANDRRTVNRVVELVRACPDEHFNSMQLAKAAGVSVRQLQQSFTGFTGVSPALWLRLRRLNAARRDLLKASVHETTVAQVAMRWSFWHLGRFSRAYKELFNELPSCTLSRKF